MTASLLYPAQCILGEGPTWHTKRKTCFWVDIEKQLLFEFNMETREINSWKIPHRVSLVIEEENNSLLLGLQGGLARFDLATGELKWLLDIDREKNNHRCNDGAVDCEGRLWIGTMERNFKENAGALYCVDKNLSLTMKVGKVTISNGMCWSPDNKRFYYIDTPRQTVTSFLFDPSEGEIRFEKIAIQVPPVMGMPDGMAIDQEGMLWIAHWGGFGVYRWNPENGKLLDKIDVPVPQVTACAFFGDELDGLIITTASDKLAKKDLKKYPHSGDTFVAKTKVKGAAKHGCCLGKP
ncbi:MAG TPA: SMP-30/gluconolactonase/LRE family protein [Puia sp.]|nr:SMP-30/gluconolactonase/LRE family protein [Puia sp.]